MDTSYITVCAWLNIFCNYFSLIFLYCGNKQERKSL